MKTKVLVVEDSLVFRQILVRNLNEDPDIEVVAVAGDPFEARDKIILHKPDVMTLDIELPKMSGLEFLRKLMPQYPIRTVVISSLSDKVFDALHAGAVDFIVKPVGANSVQIEEFVKKELVHKVKIAATARLKRVSSLSGSERNNENVLQRTNEMLVNRSVTSREVSSGKQMVIAIGASTGGTEATTEVLKGFGSDIPPVVVTQHMPAGFTKMYAERLDQRYRDKFRVKEAQTGDILQPGLVLIAPGGDAHMELVRVNGQLQVVLRRTAKVNGHCPSVEVLFDSVAKEVGANAIGIILTGMGGDGAKGLLNMRKAGARTIGQDESTCVVYGMPKVAYDLGAVEYQERLENIAKRTYNLLGYNSR